MISAFPYILNIHFLCIPYLFIFSVLRMKHSAIQKQDSKWLLSCSHHIVVSKRSAKEYKFRETEVFKWINWLNLFTSSTKGGEWLSKNTSFTFSSFSSHLFLWLHQLCTSGLIKHCKKSVSHKLKGAQV